MQGFLCPPSDYHGDDGLGDAPHCWPTLKDSQGVRIREDIHAAEALVAVSKRVLRDLRPLLTAWGDRFPGPLPLGPGGTATWSFARCSAPERTSGS